MHMGKAKKRVIPKLTSINPIDARVPHENARRPVRRTVPVDGVLLHVPDVNDIVRIALEAVAHALLPVVRHPGLRQHLAAAAARAQPFRRHRVQVTAGDLAPEQLLAIGRQRDTVGAHGRIPNGAVLALRQPVQRLAPHMRDELPLGPHRGQAVQVSPGLARAKVDDDDAIAALVAAVGDVCDAGAARGPGEVAPQVEAHVVEVGEGRRDVRRKDDGLDDGVGGQVDAD